MTWATRFRTQQYFRESLWIGPLVGVLLGLLAALIVVTVTVLVVIREYGRSSIQVMRRMRAMLERLSEEVLPERRAQVHHEIKRIDATVAQSFKDSIDQDRASVADRQGIGGPGRLEQPS